MAPNLIGNTFILAESTIETDGSTAGKRVAVCSTPNAERVSSPAAAVVTSHQKKPYKLEIVWTNVVIFAILHMMAFYGVYLVFAENAYLEFVLSYIVGIFGGFGVTAGAHRLWSHRAYKARLPMKIFLMFCQTLAFQNCIYEWVRDHRVHHKFTDTNADPHSSKRGFFFSHMGWLMCKKHPDVLEKGKTVDMSDLEADPVVMFQKKHYMTLMPFFCFVVPALIPYFVVGSSMKICFFVCSIFRYVLSLHYTWLVNSAAHFYGTRAYDKSISASNNWLVSVLANGEGWHNYHHVFPWDYKAAELGNYRANFTTGCIDIFAKLGMAYDLKTVSPSLIQKRVLRTGDGTIKVKEVNNNNVDELIQQLNHENEEQLVWGWDDKDMSEEDKREAFITKKGD